MVNLATAGAIASIISAGMSLPGLLDKLKPGKTRNIKEVKKSLELLRKLPQVYSTLKRIQGSLDDITSSLQPLYKDLENYISRSNSVSQKIEGDTITDNYIGFHNNPGHQKLEEFIGYCNTHRMNGHFLAEITDIKKVRDYLDKVRGAFNRCVNLVRKISIVDEKTEKQLQEATYNILYWMYELKKELSKLTGIVKGQIDNTQNGIKSIANNFGIYNILKESL